MESCFWRVLLVAGAAAATTILPPKKELLSYEDALALAVNLYNQKAGEYFTYRLLNAAPQPNWAVKKCAGFYFPNKDPRGKTAFTFRIRIHGPEPNRVKRSWLNKNFQKLKNHLRKKFKDDGMVLSVHVNF